MGTFTVQPLEWFKDGGKLVLRNPYAIISDAKHPCLWLFLDFETERGADGAMTGYAFPDMLVDVVRLVMHTPCAVGILLCEATAHGVRLHLSRFPCELSCSPRW